MKCSKVFSAQYFALFFSCALGLAACDSTQNPATVVQFKNGISVGFEDGICVVKNTTSKEDVAPTVMVVLNPAKAPEIDEYTVASGDAFVMHPNHPPQIPEFPIFIVSSKNKIAHVVGDQSAVPKNIVNESIPLAAAGRRTCAVAAQAVGKTAKATEAKTK